MRNTIKAAVLACGLAASALASAQVTTNVYSSFGTFDGPPIAGLVGTLDTPGVTFATDNGYAWHPFGLGSFGSESTGTLSVAAPGVYSFGLDSDDGSTLYIDGALVVSNGGAHGPFTVSSPALLSAGLHSFTVNFYEDFGGPSGVDLILPDGVTITGAIPEPETYALMLAGLGVVGAVARRRRA
jgi:hypothetical protein